MPFCIFSCIIHSCTICWVPWHMPNHATLSTFLFSYSFLYACFVELFWNICNLRKALFIWISSNMHFFFYLVWTWNLVIIQYLVQLLGQTFSNCWVCLNSPKFMLIRLNRCLCFHRIYISKLFWFYVKHWKGIW